MVSPYKDKINAVYAPLKNYFTVEDCVELNKYLGTELYYHSDLSINPPQYLLTDTIINFTP